MVPDVDVSSLNVAVASLSTGNMTGMVGTALYVSPEVEGNTKATYNQVGILSFFLSLDFVHIQQYFTHTINLLQGNRGGFTVLVVENSYFEQH